MLPQMPLPVFILSCWWIISPSVAVYAPTPDLSSCGLLSNSHYYVRESSDCIFCVSLDGSNHHQFHFPDRTIYAPQLSRENPDRLYFLTKTSGTITPGGPYSLIGANLINSSTWVVADLSDVFPLFTVMVEEAGIDFALIWEHGVSIWTAGQEQRFEMGNSRRVWDLSFDSERKKLSWLTTSDPKVIHNWDVHYEIQKIEVNEFDLTSRQTSTTSISLPQPSTICQLMENSEDRIILMIWTIKAFTLWEEACFLFGYRTNVHFNEILLFYEKKNGEVQEKRSFDDLRLWDHHRQWLVGSDPLGNTPISIINWRTGSSTVLPERSFYGLEVTDGGDPFILNDNGILVFNQESLQVKSHWGTHMIEE